MKSRCNWLFETQEYLKQDIPKKRYFMVHKNLPSLHHSPKSSPEQTARASSIHNHLPNTIKPNPVPIDLEHIIEKKDSEIQTLKTLYQEANKRLKNLEKTLIIKKNSNSINSLKRPSIYSPSQIKSKINPPPRTKSTINYNNLNPEKLTIHKKILQSRPKVILSSPITGLPLNYIN